MTVETATYLDSLSSSNPGTTDQIPEGDDHLRLIKAVLKATFPGRGGEEGRTITKAAGYTPALTEVGATFVHTATLAVTLAALAGLPDGTFYNFTAQTGTTTLTPNGADTINGTTTFVLTVGQSCEIVKQGTNWVVLAAPLVAASQAEMEAGVLATLRAMSPLLVAQAIAKLGTPAGTIIDFAGTAAPTGWLACPLTATNISRTTYAALFAAIGTTWGVGDGSTTFGMPWFPANYATVQANANVGTATIGEVASHRHRIPDSYNTVSGGSAWLTAGSLGLVSTLYSDYTGGAANLAAGHRVLKCVKY